MRILPLADTADWIRREHETAGAVFGIPSAAMYRHRPRAEGPRFFRYGRYLETPLGTAAGPHTQLCQNIVSAWLCGARYIELKTVQVLDRLTIPRPCIDMEDVGYNCEWSQELTLDESYHQYADAWVLLHALKAWLPENQADAVSRGDRLDHERRGPGFIFNMSVGYDLKGIQSPTVRRFMDRMAGRIRNEGTVGDKSADIRGIFPGIGDIHVPGMISDNVTLSTMHGCPPEEIEKIGRYLLGEGFHTTIKLNPTLLGPETLRGILNGRHGFSAEVPDEAFGHDLKWDDALEIIRGLNSLARGKGLGFGVKLSNTLECVNNRAVFPPAEKMMYLSGRALFPLTLRLAEKLAAAFQGDLDISFAGGADCNSFPGLVRAGLWPVTVCSDILRPGGYMRLPQYLGNLEKENGLPRKTAESVDAKTADTEALAELAVQAENDPRYHNNYYETRSIKNSRPLNAFDCTAAPCTAACPLGQRVPEYIGALSSGDGADAAAVIRKDNPTAALCAMVCERPCELACTRLNYDKSLAIRDLKRYALASSPDPPVNISSAGGNRGALVHKKAAVIGAGPAGIACAWELAVRGVQVTVFDSAAGAGGMAARVIPPYRIRREDILRDVNRLIEAGVRFKYNTPISGTEAAAMASSGYNALFVATGAPMDKGLGIALENTENTMGALRFLEHAKSSDLALRDKKVVIVGGGNSAMDAARSAVRLVRPNGSVILLYRRKIIHMPADKEELAAIIEEGVEIHELVQPLSFRSEAAGNGGTASSLVRCIRMKLEEKDDSGRPAPVPLPGSEFTLPADLLIYAVGQERDRAFFRGLGLEPMKDSPAGGDARVYFGGDAVRGPSNVVLSAADGREAARKILAAFGTADGDSAENTAADTDKGTDAPAPAGIPDIERWAARAGNVAGRVEPKIAPLGSRGMSNLVIEDLTPDEAVMEAGRCLRCDRVCNICVTVCPNRANVYYAADPARFPVYRLTPAGQGRKSSGNSVPVNFAREGWFEVSQGIQTAHIIDFCNQCGNCTTFCPSGGSPFRDKPRICLTEAGFSSEDDVYRFGTEPGPVIFYKKDGRIFSLKEEEEMYRYTSDTTDIVFNRGTMEITEAVLADRMFLYGNESAVFENTTHRAAVMAFLLSRLGRTYIVQGR